LAWIVCEADPAAGIEAPELVCRYFGRPVVNQILQRTE